MLHRRSFLTVSARPPKRRRPSPRALNTSRDFSIRFMPGRHVAVQITGAIKPRAMHVQTHSVFPCAPVLAGNRINLRSRDRKTNEHLGTDMLPGVVVRPISRLLTRGPGPDSRCLRLPADGFINVESVVKLSRGAPCPPRLQLPGSDRARNAPATPSPSPVL